MDDLGSQAKCMDGFERGRDLYNICPKGRFWDMLGIANPDRIAIAIGCAKTASSVCLKVGLGDGFGAWMIIRDEDEARVSKRASCECVVDSDSIGIVNPFPRLHGSNSELVGETVAYFSD